MPRIGGRQKGTPNRRTLQRQIEVARRLDDARNHGKPLAKDQIGDLLGVAMDAMGHFKGNGGSGKVDDWPNFGAWWDRAVFAAKELAKYESPQLRAIHVAQTDLRPPVLDLTRLSVRQLEALAQLVQLAGPVNVAGDGAKVINGKAGTAEVDGVPE
jgi:hypothetical protein